MLKSRRQRLLRFFDESDLDLLLIEQPINLRYLSGFSGSEGALLLTPEGGWFICDSRYTVQAGREVSGLSVVEQAQRQEGIAELIRQAGARRVGFEAAHTTVSAHQGMVTRLPEVTLVPLGQELDAIRNCKDAQELQLLADVAALASSALGSVLPLVCPGMVEADLALELEFAMRRRGSEGAGFDIIVASGVRGAMPHGRASTKQIEAGDLVTIDFGAVQQGYHSDETVTVAVGAVNERQQRIYQVVLEAHDRAIASIRPGITCRELDAVARDYIHEQGFGEYFGHGLGHGVGLAVHEKPVVSPRSDAVVEEGMVFTIEPGIYIPGFGGVRIEDTVAVTADGCRLLTTASKQLQIL
ncbi:MAG: aminopeptidase P family protein [Geobacter sp.]|jgi:Xaa-Pro aminopeptidase|nr:aminopeptidase P family protein [Geobacter sp.]